MTKLTAARRRLLIRVSWLAILASLAVTHPAGAQEGGDADPDADAAGNGELQVDSLSMFVPSNGEFVVDFATDGLALDDVVFYSLREPLAGDAQSVADQLAELRLGGPLPPPVHGRRSVPLSELVSEQGTARLTIAVRGRSGDSDRLYLPNPGAHPVEITVTDSEGNPRSSVTAFLNHLPRPEAADDDSPLPFSVALFADSASPPVFGPDGRSDLSTESTAMAQWLGGLGDVIDERSVNIFVDPQLLDGLAFAGEAASPLLESIRSTLARQHVIAGPWAPLHSEAWAEYGSLAGLRTLLEAGERTTEVQGRTTPASNVWRLDDTIGTMSAGQLSRAGIDSILLSGSQLPESEEPYPTNRLVEMTDRTGARLRAVVVDEGAGLVLADQQRDPAVVANSVAAQVLASQIDSPGGGTAIEISEMTPTSSLTTFTAGFTDDVADQVELVDMESLFNRLEAGAADREVAEVTPMDPSSVPDISRVAERVNELRVLQAGLTTMLSPADPLAQQVSVGITASTHRDLSIPQMHTYLDGAEETAQGVFNSIDVVTRPVTLTAREVDIPLRITNGLDRDVTVALMLESPRIDFVDGSRQLVVLAPGENRLEVPVIVRAGGEFQMNVDLMSPDGGVLIDEAQYQIRSSIFSGVGLILSGGALVVLVTWWMRTWKRRDGTNTTDADRETSSVR